jgi:hypothetical protein
MNWIDLILISTTIFGIFVGWRIGFLGGIFAAIGIYVGMFLGGQFTDDISAALTQSVSSDAIATSLAYAIVVGSSLAAAMVARSIIKKILTLILLGWIDMLGSLLLGLITGILLAGALVTFTARYSDDITDRGTLGTIVEMSGFRAEVNDALAESSLVPIWLEMVDVIPANALGMVPNDFSLALKNLQKKIEPKEDR